MMKFSLVMKFPKLRIARISSRLLASVLLMGFLLGLGLSVPQPVQAAPVLGDFFDVVWTAIAIDCLQSVSRVDDQTKLQNATAENAVVTTRLCRDAELELHRYFLSFSVSRLSNENRSIHV